MQVRAIAKYQRISPRKIRLVLDTIRGARAGQALNQLKFMPHTAARYVEKVVKSAVANAEDRQVGDVDDLVIAAAWADGGPTLKRIRPMPQGKAGRIIKRTSHITVVVQPIGN
ncbi:MAG: 50S ribosomal protein L22 [Nitrospirota bacterium]|nr:50S ribosomal protein L22 [Nitrospirota bacterium]